MLHPQGLREPRACGKQRDQRDRAASGQVPARHVANLRPPLTNSAEGSLLFNMKASVFPLCLLLLGAPAALAQITQASASRTATGAGPAAEQSSSILPAGGLQLEVAPAEPSARASGPLTAPFRSRSTAEASKKVLNLFNPFANVQPDPVVTRSRGLTSRSWTGVVGWNPGRSQFPDERTHQVGITLVSLQRGR